MTLTYAEFCAGYGGLGLAVEDVFNAELSWYSEFKDAPSKIMAHHWPDAPNHGDMTTIDFTQVEPVDILSGGTPCQDLSAAGRRAGMRKGTRSGLWESMREAIATIKPTYVVWENVRGAYSAGADSEVEQCPGCMGEARDGEHFLRALGRVLGDLSDLGYDTQWCGLRAADVGAPHGRFRVFILATRRDVAEDTSGRRGRGWGTVAGAGEGREPDVTTLGAGHRHGGPGSVQRHMEGEPAKGGCVTADADHERGDRRGEWSIQGGWGQSVHGGDTTSHTQSLGPGNDIERGRQGLPAPAGTGSTGGSTADTERLERERRGVPRYMGSATSSREVDRQQRERIREAVGDSGTGTRIDWRQYSTAIRRWEAILGRPAPAPTELSDKGKHRLSARFSEWMMGLPAGWVTDIDISRNEQHKAIGNGVVPQQAAAALDHMLSMKRMENAA